MMHRHVKFNPTHENDVWLDLTSPPTYSAPDEDDPDLWKISVEPREHFNLIDVLHAAKRLAVERNAKVELRLRGSSFVIRPDSDINALVRVWMRGADDPTEDYVARTIREDLACLADDPEFLYEVAHLNRAVGLPYDEDHIREGQRLRREKWTLKKYHWRKYRLRRCR